MNNVFQILSIIDKRSVELGINLSKGKLSDHKSFVLYAYREKK